MKKRRPFIDLPVDDEAAIENAWERIRGRRCKYLIMFPLIVPKLELFNPIAPTLTSFSPIAPMYPLPWFSLPEPQPKHAGLRREFRDYSRELFNAEAAYYPSYARDETQLAAGLNALASSIDVAVMEETRPWWEIHNTHCTASERRQAMCDGMQQRIDFYLKYFRESGPRLASITATILPAQPNRLLAAGNEPLQSPQSILAPNPAPVGMDRTKDTEADRKARRCLKLERYKSSFRDSVPSENMIASGAYYRLSAASASRTFRLWKTGRYDDSVQTSKAVDRLIDSGLHPEAYRKLKLESR